MNLVHKYSRRFRERPFENFLAPGTVGLATLCAMDKAEHCLDSHQIARRIEGHDHDAVAATLQEMLSSPHPWSQLVEYVPYDERDDGESRGALRLTNHFSAWQVRHVGCIMMDMADAMTHDDWSELGRLSKERREFVEMFHELAQELK